jgi:hypothetical protein
MADVKNTNANILYNLTSRSIIITIIIIILCLIFTGIYLLFPSKFGTAPNTSHFDIISITILALSVLSLIIFVAWLFIPSTKVLVQFLSKLKGEASIFLFLISLVTLFYNLSSDAINYYAFLIVPIVLCVASWLFYKAITTKKDDFFDMILDFNKLKFSMIYLLFIAFLVIMYIADPGKYISSLFGPTATVTILLLLFGFIYLITFISFPSLDKSSAKDSYIPILSGFQPISIILSIGFIAFLIGSVYAIYVSEIPVNFSSTSSFALTVSIGITIALLFTLLLNLVLFKPTQTPNNVNKEQHEVWEYTKSTFLILTGLITSGILSYWIYSMSQYLSTANNTATNTIGFIFNIALILVGFIIIYKLISNSSFFKDSPLFRLIINSLFYLPCIIVNILEAIMNLFTSINTDHAKEIVNATKNTTTTEYVIFLVVIVLYLFRFIFMPYWSESIGSQGGTLLVNQPVTSNSLNVLGNYLQLNNIKNPTGGTGVNAPTHNPPARNYNYAISFWTFIDSNSSNRVDNFMSLLNYGEVPNVLYNPVQNVLMVTVKNTGEKIDDISNNPPEKDYNGSLIVYKQHNVLLQKWNNIILNYNGGTLDIFINGELVKSAINVVPEISYSALTIGEKNGVDGNICNVIYFNKNLNIKEVYYIYNSNKNKTPPALLDNSETIVPDEARKQQPSYTSSIDLPSVTNIDIPLSFKPDKDTSANAKALIEDVGVDNTDTNYLSLKWFFSNNGDNINGLQ